MNPQTAFKQVADNALSTSATNLSAPGVTAITVDTGDGALFPVPGNGFYLTLWNGADPSADPNMEKVLCSGRTGDSFTISATTLAHTSPCNVGLLDVAQNTTDLQKAVNATESILSSIARSNKRGVSLSGLEFAGDTIPGTANVTYSIPVEDDFKYYAKKGFQLVRLPFLWERLQPTVMGDFDATYKGYIDSAIGFARKYNLQLVPEPHNYGSRYMSGVKRTIGDGTLTLAHFADFWTRFATFYKDEPAIFMYDLMNETHDMPIGTTTGNYMLQEGTMQLISNPSFATNGDGWYADSEFTLSAESPWNGGYCIKQVSTGGYQSLGSGAGIPVTPNTDYVATFYYKITADGQYAAPHVRINRGSMFNDPITDVQPLIPTGTWTRVTVPFNSGAYSQVWLQIQNNGNPVTAYYDGFNLTPGSVATDFIATTNTGVVSTNSAMTQAGIDAIRAVDPDTWIAVETDHFASLSGFTSTYGSDPTPWWTDPSNKTMVSFHYYFDSDHSGAYSGAWDVAYRNRIPADCLPAFKWARKHNVPVFMGEYGVLNDNADYLADMDTFMQYMDEYGVYGTHWAGGSWYTSPTSIQPENNYTTDKGQMVVLQKHLSFAFQPTTFAALADVVTAGTVGSSNQIPVLVIDSKGRVTGYSTVTISGGGGGSGTPGGDDHQLQYNDDGAFAGAGIWWNGSQIAIGEEVYNKTFNVTGDGFVVRSSDGSKAFRARFGGATDFESVGDLYISCWSGNNYTGAQHNQLILRANGGPIEVMRTLIPGDNNAKLGTASSAWPALYMALNSIIDFGNGDVTITHAADSITISKGALINYNNTSDSVQQVITDGGSDLKSRIDLIGNGPNGRGKMIISGSHTGFDGTQVGDGPMIVDMIAANQAANPLHFSWTMANGVKMLKLDVVNDGTGTSIAGILKFMPNGDIRLGIGDIEIENFAKGVVLRSPNNTRYRITVDNDGILTTTGI